MGYDCTVLGYQGPPAPKVNWSDDKSRDEYYEWEKDSHSYFRRNIFGMGPTRDAMLELGMGFWAEDYPNCHRPEFPRTEDYGVTEWDDEGMAANGRADEYNEALKAVLSWHGPEIPGIPLHKFCSNDGWIVTREECRAAVKLYEMALREGKSHPEFFQDDFIPFLIEGARADGFEVC